MTEKPLIAVTVSYEGEHTMMLREEYFYAISDAGGIPVALPYATTAQIQQFAREFDGFLFSGGVDVHPSYYGEEITADNVRVDAARDAFECSLFHAAFQEKKPILGICRGIQLINVALGGTLHQDIPNHIQIPPGDCCSQNVTISPHTLLYSLINQTTLTVNSFHHQSVNDLADGLRVSAVSDDGIIEGVELPQTEYPYLTAVQWHPERFYKKEESAKRLFLSFVAACNKPVN